MNQKMMKRKAFKSDMKRKQLHAQLNIEIKDESNIVISSVESNESNESEFDLKIEINENINNVKIENINNVKNEIENEKQNKTDENHVFGPLDFLPPLPVGLILIDYYRQVMSPTFSRWLCVIEKKS
jgi:hypothetical protein